MNKEKQTIEERVETLEPVLGILLVGLGKIDISVIIKDEQPKLYRIKLPNTEDILFKQHG